MRRGEECLCVMGGWDDAWWREEGESVLIGA